MKIKRVLANNKKKAFTLETKKGIFSFPYSQLTIKPTSDDPLVSVFVDKEIASEGFTYQLTSGHEDTVLAEQVLDYNKDPDYLNEKLLYELTLEAQDRLKKSKISKREIARKLKTSPAALYRLLDQTYYGKSIDQMVKLIHALGGEVGIKVRDAG